MTFEEIRSAILNLGTDDQKKVITHILPLIWPKACGDDSCLLKVRELVDEEMVKGYREQHMGGI